MYASRVIEKRHYEYECDVSAQILWSSANLFLHFNIYQDFKTPQQHLKVYHKNRFLSCAESTSSLKVIPRLRVSANQCT